MLHNLPISFSTDTPEPDDKPRTTFPWPSYPDWHVSLGSGYQSLTPIMNVLDITTDAIASSTSTETILPLISPANVLLQDELKVDADRATELWDHICDWLALSWWAGPQNEVMT